MLTVDDSPNGITEVAQQMPTVSNLNRVRRPLANTVGVGAGTVTCDGLNNGVLAKPRGQSVCLSVGQQVNNPIALQIDQNSSVAMAATPGPVIDGKYPRCHRRALTGKD